MEFKEIISQPLQLIKEIRTDEAGNKKTIYKFSGPFQECNDIRDNENRNGRKYTRELWERVLNDKDVLDRLKNRRMLGELDHPTDEGQIRRTSHIIIDVTPDWDSGIINGKLEVLDHDQGDAALLKALIEQGVQVCVSSRGYGDFLKDGRTIDPKTYKLKTWDIVLDPSVSIARLNKTVESLNESLAEESRIKPFVEKVIDVGSIGNPKGESNSPANNKLSEEQKLQEEKLMDQKIIDLMEENKRIAISQATSESNLANMKAMVEDKNRAIEASEKKYEALAKKHEELESDSDQAADLLEAATTENETLKKRVAEFEALEDEAATLIENQKKTIDELTAKVNEQEVTLEEQKTKLEENEALGDEAAEVISSLTEKIKEQDDDSPEKGGEKKGEKKKKSEKKKKKEQDDDDDDDETGDDDDMDESDDEDDDDKDESDDGDDDMSKKDLKKSESILDRLEETVTGRRVERKK